ncbi:phosphatidylinositol 3-kinase regulatory subunit alpha-like [Tropilaelaps mercedesae]|uniref:Phosphatidylinositol 3-kinase regulatory subunit alpha-like n=1 Tax=Tropilaelaps mercedesae TaxID=418985 RepID=A0A1V9X4P1_9ACAR|nr:phosphatidylinositol 3-kinase regulatory subunit alpha-like [Tropilaelaps mercedesae]
MMYWSMLLIYLHLQPVSEWTTRNVLEWMASVNMISYSGPFESTAIQGSDLSGLDRHKLAGMGIKEDYPQQAILVCISELCRTRGIVLTFRGWILNSSSPPQQNLSSAEESACLGMGRLREDTKNSLNNNKEHNVTATATNHQNICSNNNNNNNDSTSSSSMSSRVSTPAPPVEESQQPRSSKTALTLLHQLQPVEKCHHCETSLPGKQGLVCSNTCGIVTHAACSTSTLTVSSESGRVTDVASERSPTAATGAPVELSKQFSAAEQAAPSFVLSCIEAIELLAHRNTSLDLYAIFGAHNEPPKDDVDRLVSTLREGDLKVCELNGFAIESFVAALKNYFYELSSPLIPVGFYDRFLEAARERNDDACALKLRQLVHQLPTQHESTLRALLAHLCRLCKLQFSRGLTHPPFDVVNAFCYVLLRPHWENISSIIKNTPLHVRICSLLLSRGEWGEPLPNFTVSSPPPALPPRKMSQPLQNNSESNQNALAAAEWYWGDISREDCNEKLKDTPDGTFLVRDPTSKGSGGFTLTLRQGGCNKLIKIVHRDGRYGFTDPLTFSSVVELVQHFRTNSLEQYNALLNVKLLYPVSRFKDDESCRYDVGTFRQLLVETNRNYLIQSVRLDQFHEQFGQIRQEVDLKQHALKSFDEAIRMYDFQIVLGKQQAAKFPEHKKAFQENQDLLVERQTVLRKEKEALDEDIKNRLEYQRQLEADMSTLRLEIAHLNKQRETSQINLLKAGVGKDEINKLLQESSQLEGYLGLPSTMYWNTVGAGTDPSAVNSKASTSESSSLPHNEVKNWLVESCTRPQAEQQLQGKPHGTFLVRKSQTGQYALSLVVRSKVEHCLIIKTERGYGFAEPHTTFPTLKCLVLHYSRRSLEEHNAKLKDTTLAMPVLAETNQAQQTS